MKIKVYSKSDCVQCRFTKMWLQEHAFDYETVDVEKDDESLDKISKAGYKALPVVEIDGVMLWFGFRPEKLAEVLL